MDLIFNIPDLSGLRTESTTLFVNRFFQVSGPIERTAYGLFMNFVRIADLAIHEYELGRKSITRFKDNQESLDISAADMASGHFEFCLISIKRCIDFLKELRGNERVPQSLKDCLPRHSILLTGNVEGKVAQIRHAIAHLEGDISRGKILDGQSFCIALEEDSLTVGEHVVHYDDLATWLRELNSLASDLSSKREMSTAGGGRAAP